MTDRTATKHRWQVWRGSELSASMNPRDSYRWRWRARLSAWSRTRAGWADYFVRDRDQHEQFAKQVQDYVAQTGNAELSELRPARR